MHLLQKKIQSIMIQQILRSKTTWLSTFSYVYFITKYYLIKFPFTSNRLPLNQLECKKNNKKLLHLHSSAFDSCSLITSWRSVMKMRILLSLEMVLSLLPTNDGVFACEVRFSLSASSDWFLAMAANMLSIEAFSLPTSRLCLFVCFWSNSVFVNFEVF